MIRQPSISVAGFVFIFEREYRWVRTVRGMQLWCAGLWNLYSTIDKGIYDSSTIDMGMTMHMVRATPYPLHPFCNPCIHPGLTIWDVRGNFPNRRFPVKCTDLLHIQRIHPLLVNEQKTGCLSFTLHPLGSGSRDFSQPQLQLLQTKEISFRPAETCG